jgi:uncharacterized membrane protein
VDINLVPWILLVHVLGAIIAFGPVFSFPLIGAAGAREPMHSNFGLRLSKVISDRQVIPLALLQGITGLLLIWLAGWDLTAPRGRWLIAAIIMYVIAIANALWVTRPKVIQLVDLTSGPRPADAPPGPPPGAPALIATIQRAGMINTVLIVLIVVLMVVKPAF